MLFGLVVAPGQAPMASAAIARAPRRTAATRHWCLRTPRSVACPSRAAAAPTTRLSPEGRKALRRARPDPHPASLPPTTPPRRSCKARGLRVRPSSTLGSLAGSLSSLIVGVLPQTPRAGLGVSLTLRKLACWRAGAHRLWRRVHRRHHTEARGLRRRIRRYDCAWSWCGRWTSNRSW
jgi:hypothetical protein